MTALMSGRTLAWACALVCLATSGCASAFLGARAIGGIGARAGIAEAASLRAASGLSIRGGVAVGASRGALLTEAGIATTFRAGGMRGVLAELSGLRPFVDGMGRISAGGRQVMVLDRFGTIRLPSSGRVIGHVERGGVFEATSGLRPRTQVGEFHAPRGFVEGSAVLDVQAVRPGWYRITVVPGYAAGANLGIAALGMGGLAAIEAQRDSLRTLVVHAERSGAIRRAQPVRVGQQLSSSTPEISDARARLEQYMRQKK